MFYPDAYGASGSTATIVAATTANSKVIVASGGVGDFKVSHGVHIMGAGPAVVYRGATLNMPTCVGSPCTGTHSYSWVVITPIRSGNVTRPAQLFQDLDAGYRYSWLCAIFKMLAAPNDCSLQSDFI